MHAATDNRQSIITSRLFVKPLMSNTWTFGDNDAIHQTRRSTERYFEQF